MGKKHAKIELHFIEEGPPPMSEEEREGKLEFILSEITDMIQAHINKDHEHEGRMPLSKQQVREGIYYWATNQDHHR